jgi:predicted transcriptional regulator YheO
LNQTEIEHIFELLQRLVSGLAATIGTNCELVLHDFSNPEQSIRAIANGHVTGRKVGDSVDVLGLQILKQTKSEDLINYETKSKNGKTLRSSSIFIRGASGEILGSICINCDITALLMLQDWLPQPPSQHGPKPVERFESNVDEILQNMIQDSINQTGRKIPTLTREDKIQVIENLEARGAFLIRYSVEHVAKILNTSKYTIYNYLDEIKAKNSIRSSDVQTTADG